MWPRVTSVVVGIWLMAAPAVLGYGDPARMVDHIMGPIAASAAIVAMSAVVRGVRWLEVVAGMALVAVPWPLGYAMEPVVNSVVAGALLMTFGLLGGRVHRRFGGGWAALFR